MCGRQTDFIKTTGFDKWLWTRTRVEGKLRVPDVKSFADCRALHFVHLPRMMNNMNMPGMGMPNMGGMMRQREGVSFAHAHTLLFWMLVKQCVENEQATADDGHDATSNVSWMKMCRNFRWMGVDTTFVFHSWFCKKPLGPGFLDKTISFG